MTMTSPFRNIYFREQFIVSVTLEIFVYTEMCTPLLYLATLYIPHFVVPPQ